MPPTGKIVSNAAEPNPKALIWKEREGAEEFPSQMFEYLEGKEKAKIILSILKQFERDPVLSAKLSDYDLTKEEQRLLTLQRIERMSRFVETETREKFNRRLQLITVYDGHTGIRIGVNLGLFGKCIQGTGTPEQYKYWCEEKRGAYLQGIYGCFGMTELAHGSNVAGVETTATFDEETDEFILDTPHIGATKWWIGGAAHSATHCAVYARLIVKGKDYGVKTFVAPLRDSNHEIMAGVSLGDIGAKMGRDGIDNGWIQFSDYRIPREFMLQKYSKVSRTGEVVLPPLEQLSYISLLEGRVSMGVDSYRICARFLTVAIRYAVGRRQFMPNLDLNEGEEMQIMDYPLHQRRLLPLLAQTYAMAFSTDKFEKYHSNVVSSLNSAYERGDMKELQKWINETKSLFIDSAAIKSTLTWTAADTITEARQSCGGHGYSSYNGFGKAYDDWVVQCTWEGDNNVLAISVGKAVITNVQSVLEKGKKVGGTFAFLNKAKDLAGDKPVFSGKDHQDPKKVLLALETAMIRVAAAAGEELKSGASWDDLSPTRVLLSKMRCHQYLLSNFIERTESSPGNLRPDLENLLKLYASVIILEGFNVQLLSFKVATHDALKESTSKYVLELCATVRKRAIILTDSFQQPDLLINSAIGKYDGDIYNNYFGTVKELNNPKDHKTHYHEDLVNMLHRGPLEERDRFEKERELLDDFNVDNVPSAANEDDDDDDDE